MIKIDLKLFATLTKYLPENADAHEVSASKSVESLIKDLGIPDGLVKLIFINGKRKGPDYCLKDGDRVGIFPPVGGG